MRYRTGWIMLLALAALLLTNRPAVAGGWVTVELECAAGRPARGRGGDGGLSGAAARQQAHQPSTRRRC